MLENLLKKYNLKPNKRLGQHFLIKEKYLDLSVKEANIGPEDVVLEVGPGPGTLTSRLLEKAKKVIAIELDHSYVHLLNEEYGKRNLELIHGDALKVQWPHFDIFVANIPYQISSEIVEKLGTLGKPAVVMFQKEFAQRLIAQAGERDYSRLSVLAQYHFTPMFLADVPKAAFYPPPEVDSALIKLIPRKQKPHVENEELFFLAVKSLFMHRNQKVHKSFVNSRHMFSFEKDEAKKIAESMPHREKKVYELDMYELVEVSDYLSSIS